MRDPELVVRAQLAASALEGAWRRWRVVHGDRPDSKPAVSSYVGYSLQEPWGQPRVVLGLAAQDAEQLAALIERHDCGGPAYAASATQAGVRGLPAWTGARVAPAAAPRQAPLVAASRRIVQSLPDDVFLAGENACYDEPVYRQAAAAMKEAAAARENASLTRPDGAVPADTQLSREDSDSIAAGQSGIADQVSQEWMGTLARAASTARAEAEARIRATLADPDDEPADACEPDACEPDADAGDLAAADGQEAGLDDVQDPGIDDDGENDARSALPQIYATDVLEPLPTPEADVAAAEEPAEAPGHDDQDQDDQEPDARDGNVSDDIPEKDDHEAADSAQPGGADVGPARRGRVNRGHPIARLSKTKRPGASSQAAGS